MALFTSPWGSRPLAACSSAMIRASFPGPYCSLKNSFLFRHDGGNCCQLRFSRRSCRRGHGGALTGRFGRRKMIILAGIIFTVSAIGTALAPTVAWLIAARVVSGIGIGIASFISPMYIAELVPAKVRGSLVAVNMLAITTRHRGRLPGGLCIFRHPGMAIYVRPGGNTIHRRWSSECGGCPTVRAG